MIRAVLLDKRKIRIEESDPPEIERGKAVIQVTSNGICGGDMRLYSGKGRVEKPIVRGHEFAGIIKALGSKTRKLRVGMKVVINPALYCGKCYYCRKSMEHLCEKMKVFGGAIDGGMQEELLVPLESIIPLEDSFDLTYGPLIEPTAFAFHVVNQTHSSNVVVIGLGTIGLLVQQVCKLNKNRVISLDVEDYPMTLSRQLGSDLVLSIKDSDRKEKIEDFLKDEKVDVVFDNVCTPSTLDFATSIVKNHGRVVLVGIPSANIELDKSLMNRELQIIFKWLYRRKDFNEAVDHILNSTIQYKPLLSKIFPLRDARDAFEYKLNNPVIKVVLKHG